MSCLSSLHVGRWIHCFTHLLQAFIFLFWGLSFFSFRLPLQCKSFLGDEMPFKSFAVVVIILSIDSKRTCFDSCQSVFAYIFLKRIRAIFRPFNSSSYLDFFFCKQLGRDVNSFPFPLFNEAPPCPSWLLTAYIASISVGDFPCLHVLSSILLVNLRT